MSKVSFTEPRNIEFEFLHKYIGMQLDPGLADAKELRLRVEDRLEYLSKQIVADWRDTAHRLVDDKYSVKFYFPATPWQHFKAKHMPQWFRDRYPVRNKSYRRTVKFTRYATYPMANYKVQNQGRITIPFLGNIERIEDRVEEYGE